MMQLPATCGVGSELADFDAKNGDQLASFITRTKARIKADLPPDHPYQNWDFAEEARSASRDFYSDRLPLSFPVVSFPVQKR